jgi:hypothetical protein
VQVPGNSTSAKTLRVNINNASVYATSVGVRVDQGAGGLGDVRVIGTGAGVISANGAASTGILARNLNAANNGNIVVDVTQNVSGVAQGISATTVGGGNINVVARGNVAATAGTGIAATNTNVAANTGTISVGVLAGQLISATGGNGIITDSGKSAGLTSIVVLGEVKASGAGFAGIKGTSSNGDILVQVGSSGKVDPDIGVDLATSNGALSVVNAGLIQGDVTAVKLVAGGTGTANVNNSGTVTGGTNAVLGSTNNTSFLITNSASGIMNGAIHVTGSALFTSQILNAGTWNATGASQFSGSWANTGTTNIANGAAVTVTGPTTNSGTIRLAGSANLTTNLTNSGSIVAQNGATGGALVLTGNYVGAGGQFTADFNTGTALADTFRITGSATGATNVALNRNGIGFLAGGFLPIVTVVPGAVAQTFFSTTPFATTGFLLESFGQNPTSNTQWGIVQSVNPFASDLGGIAALGAAASRTLDEPASSFATRKHDASPSQKQFGMWLRGGAGETNQDLATTLSTGGFSQSTNTRFNMSHEMLQVGVDYGILNMAGNGWNLHVGLTGGRFDAGAKRFGSSSNIQLEGSFVGGYAFVTNNALTIDAAIRREERDYKFISPALLGGPDIQNTSGEATIGSIHVSYRFGQDTGLQLTPQLGYSFGDSEINPFAIDALSTFNAGEDKKQIGQAGVMLSYRGSAENGKLRVEPFAGVAALQNSSRRANASVLFAGTSPTTFNVDTIVFRNAIRYSLGIWEADQTGRISASAAVRLTEGDLIDAASLNLGMWINF